VLTITLDRAVRVLEVSGFSDRRGDAAAAAAIYVDRSPLPADEQPAGAVVPGAAPGRRERRAAAALRGKLPWG